MTASANNGENITVDVNGNSVTVKLEDASELITKLLAARKAGYEQRRVAKASEVKAAKVEREAKAAERRVAAAKRTADRIAKLEKTLKDAKAKAAKAA